MKTFMALYMGSPQAAAQRPDEETIKKGMAAWGQWMAENAGAVVDQGGPLGKTKKIDKAGESDISNAVTGYVIVNAEDHAAAAAMFENHPHFTIFPGESVEVMEVMPMPST